MGAAWHRAHRRVPPARRNGSTATNEPLENPRCVSSSAGALVRIRVSRRVSAPRSPRATPRTQSPPGGRKVWWHLLQLLRQSRRARASAPNLRGSLSRSTTDGKIGGSFSERHPAPQ